MGIRSFVANSALASAFCGSSIALPGELFAGVEKPSTTLVKMLIAEMFQHVNDVKFSRENEYRGNMKEGFTANFPSFTLAYDVRKEKWYNEPAGVWFDSFRLNADRFFTPDADEIKLIKNALEKWIPLRQAFKNNEVENKRQQKAVDLIEAIFKKPEPAATNELPKPMADPDLSMFDRIKESPLTRGL